MDKKIKVIVVDDSQVVRQMFTSLLNSSPEIEVVDTAEDPYDAREKIKRLNPDVITLDVEMPKMDGISFLSKIMRLRPMPVVMVSTLTQKGAATALKALEIGAVDYVAKPIDRQDETSLSTLKDELIKKVKAASKANIQQPVKQEPISLSIAKNTKFTKSVIAIGSSTGGVEALKMVLTRMPSNMPPIIIVQHMPQRFTETFADRINDCCKLSVSEASDGQKIEPDNVYVARGGRHLVVVKRNGQVFCKIRGEEPVSGHSPSVDVMFDSIADVYGEQALGVILTGMGKDGARGMLKMKECGAFNIGQNEESSVVYGMPREAFKNGAVDVQVPLQKVADEIVVRCTS